jgi:hypothetical protein
MGEMQLRRSLWQLPERSLSSFVHTILLWSGTLNLGGGEVEQLIEAVLEHARQLRRKAQALDESGTGAVIEEAEQWERMAKVAQNELARLMPPHHDS